MQGPHPAATAATTDEARAARTEAEWEAVRDRATFVRATVRAMKADDDVRRAALHAGLASSYSAWTRGDWELNTLLMRADAVFRAADTLEALPDAGREDSLGVEGYLDAMRAYREPWDEPAIDLREIVHTDPQRVVALLRFTGRGTLSGAPFDRFALVEMRFEEGELAEQTYWWDSARGLEALGMHEQGPRR